MRLVGNKVLSVILSVVLAVGMMPSSAFAVASAKGAAPDAPTAVTAPDAPAAATAPDAAGVPAAGDYVALVRVESGNPIYGGEGPHVVSEALVPVASAAEGTTVLSEDGLTVQNTPPTLNAGLSDEDAVAAIRNALVNSEPTVVVQANVAGTFEDTTPVQEKGRELMEAAFEETGNPYEGDYQRWRYAGWTFNATWNTVVATYTISLSYYTTAAQETVLKQRVDQIMTGLDLGEKCSYDKAVAIHDWIVRNVAYDFVNLDDKTNLLKHTAYAAVVDGMAVCQGFAELYYAMCHLAGIDCRLIPGVALGGGHAWNIVQMKNGLYYDVDCTWDRNYSIDDRQGPAGVPSTVHKDWLLLDEGQFVDHQRDAEYATAEFNARYPMGSAKYDQAADLAGCSRGIHELKTLPSVEPTCTQPGGFRKTCLCCAQLFSGDTPALGHDLVHHDGQAATCDEPGWEPYDTCSRCDYTSYQAVSALGHNLVSYRAKSPSCTEPGWYAYDACSRCDYSTYQAIAPLGHNLGSYPGKAATCTEDGWKAYKACYRCDYTTYEAVSALGHDLVNHGGQPASCTEPGWTAYQTCSRCDLIQGYAELAALGHDLENHAGKAATCTEDGWRAYEACSRCDYTTYQAIAALGHDLENHAGKAATCEEGGWGSYDTCSRCDYSTYQAIAPLGHILVTDPAVEPQVGVPGLTEGSHCSRCGEVIVPQRTVPALEPAEKPAQQFNAFKRTAAVNYNGSITKAAYPISALKTVDGVVVESIAKDGTHTDGPAVGALGEVSFEKVSGSEYLTITSKGAKTGKVTVAPKTPVGKHKIVVRVTLAETDEFAETSKDVEVTVQVKRFTPTITVTSKVSPYKKYSKTSAQTVTMIKSVQCAAKPLSYSILKIMDGDGEEVSAKTAAKFSCDPATGMVTFAKGTPKGTYKVRFKIESPAVAGYNYNWRTATGTFKIV